MKKIERLDFENSKQVAEAALELVLQNSREAINARGRFVLALAGGSTPARLYSLLAGTNRDWSQWYLIYGDERCLPDGDPERNSTMVELNWLKKVNFPAENHYIPEVGLGAERAAAAYGSAIEKLLPLDMALLGMGEDGHTASLFPGHSYPDQSVVAVYNSPKPPDERISLSYKTLCSARVVCYVVVGEDKQMAINAFFSGEDLPVSNVSGAQNTFIIVGKDK